MNLYRFFGLPNAFKIVEVLVIILLTMTVLLSPGTNHPGAWFFWFNIAFQFLAMIVITGTFLVESENSLTCGREIWPLFECSYSALFFFLNIINTFLCASWVGNGASSSIAAAAFFSFILVILYGLGAAMMLKIWMGFSTSSQGTAAPTTAGVATQGTVLPGDPGMMHPGV
uniref:MARVEL domain-containing protein n=1 Tax=Steinernema glaseri TaxID=37863 RepID=A0A1I7ZEL6_9BILA